MKKAFMVVACPGAGKTWVCEQLKELFDYVHHDLFIGMEGDRYVREIIARSQNATKPLLIEAPFSISQIKDPLERAGFQITPVFIQEDPKVISDRYMAREKKEIPKGHLTRQETYRQRANEWGAFRGTSTQVLEHLKRKACTDGLYGIQPESFDKWSKVGDAIEPDVIVEAPAADPKPA